MTTQDKVLIGVGVALVVAGGVVYYNKTKQPQPVEQLDFVEPTDEPVKPTFSTPSYIPAPIKTTKPVVTIVTPDKYMFSIGQYVMASQDAQTQDAEKMADGNWKTSGKNIKKFKRGEEIGKIVWQGKRPDGTVRYVVERDGSVSNLFQPYYYWVNHKHIKAIAPILKTIPLVATSKTNSSLDYNRLLFKGLYNNDEVAELQKLLGVASDGDFGQATETALKLKKGVTQIRLSDF